MRGINITRLHKAWHDAVDPPQGWQGDLYFHNRLGQQIRYGFTPAIGEEKGSIVLTHGYGESIDLYYETMKRYQGMGYNIWAMDWQGHGKSERDDPDHPKRPSAKGMLRHTHDLDFFVNNIVRHAHDENKPMMMSTHSMGGHIGLLYLKKFPGVFDAAIMSAPMFDIYRLGMGLWARPVIRGIFNAASAIGFRDKHVPSNEALRGLGRNIGAKLKNIFDTMISPRKEIRGILQNVNTESALGRPTFGWIASAFKTIVPSMEEEFLKTIKTPVLIGSAEYEDLVDNDAHRRAAALMPNARQVDIADAEHGLWFQDDKPYEQWWGHIENFEETIRSEFNSINADAIDINLIAEGANFSRTMKGRTVEHPRCPGEDSSTAAECQRISLGLTL